MTEYKAAVTPLSEDDIQDICDFVDQSHWLTYCLLQNHEINYIAI